MNQEVIVAVDVVDVVVDVVDVAVVAAVEHDEVPPPVSKVRRQIKEIFIDPMSSRCSNSSNDDDFDGDDDDLKMKLEI